MNEEESEEKGNIYVCEVIFQHLTFERVVKICLIVVFRKKLDQFKDYSHKKCVYLVNSFLASSSEHSY